MPQTDLIDREAVEAVVAQLPDAMVACDGSGTVVIANVRAEELLGCDRAELLGSRLDRFVSPAGGSSTRRCRRADGTEFTCELATSWLSTAAGRLELCSLRGRPSGEPGARAQASRMESVGQLAGGIAHDFNNLLSVIIGNAAFLADRLVPGSPERFEIDEIQRMANQASRLTSQLLRFSRRESFVPEPVDLNATVADVEHLLRRTLGARVRLEQRLQPGLPSIMADPGNIEQILVNLAVNARDAMPDGGTVTTETALVELSQADLAACTDLSPGPHVRLVVRDTGTGMPPEVAARATEAFYSTKPAGQGTGIGLATVAEIVAKSGGRLELQTAPGRGTAVQMDFPAAEATPRRRQADPATVAPVAGVRVLLVEDDPAVARIATRLLSRNRFAVTTASSGPEALEALGAADPPIQLLLTDIMMPGMPGPELARHARAAVPELPIVFMSGHVTPLVDPSAIPDAGLVLKPFTEASLIRALRAALDAQATASTSTD